jgi:RNA polymerase II subunit A small phosphatase-like protein
LENKTLVLDLDETLVHSSFRPVPNPDMILSIDIEGIQSNVYVLVRPHVDAFLEKMSEIYEIVIFTASLSQYAKPLVKRLDKNMQNFQVLFREH